MDAKTESNGDGGEGATNNSGRLDLSGVVKRGRGRPPGSKTKKEPGVDAPKRAESGEVCSDADAEFLAETVIALFEITDDLSRKAVMRKIAELPEHMKAKVAELWSVAGFNDRDRKLTKMSVSALARKYSFLAKFAPELMLLAQMSQYGLRQLRLHQTLNEMAEDYKKDKKKQNTPVTIKETLATPGPNGTTNPAEAVVS